MVFKPQGCTLTPLQCFLYSCLGAHGLSPSQSKEVSQKPSSAAELVAQSVMGKCSLSLELLSALKAQAGSCWKHHIPSLVRIYNLDSSGELREPP